MQEFFNFNEAPDFSALLGERYKGVRAKKLSLAEDIIPKIPDIVDNQTNPK